MFFNFLRIHQHLLNKLKQRNINTYNVVSKIEIIEDHPVFIEISGDIKSWEIKNIIKLAVQ